MAGSQGVAQVSVERIREYLCLVPEPPHHQCFGQAVQMSYSLDSIEGGYTGDYLGNYYRG